MSNPRAFPRAARWTPKGPYVGTINTANAGPAGQPSVDIPKLGMTNVIAQTVLLDFDPNTETASAGTAHTHGLGGPTFHPGDRVLIGFLEGNQDMPFVMGRCT